MPDLFDNFFGRIGTALNGGKSHAHYGGSSQVNTGKFYSYHSSVNNNKSWMPTSKSFDTTMDRLDESKAKPRMGSVSSMASEDGGAGATSRHGSVSSDGKIDI
ncbi:hypothetical protein CAAN3_23S00276 [[Candida] anglica]